MSADSPSIPDGFLAYPPYNGFVFEAVHLLPARHDHLNIIEVPDYALSNAIGQIQYSAAQSSDEVREENKQRDEDRQKQIKLTAVPDQYTAQFKAMQSAPNGDAAYAIGKDLSEAIRLYASAAVDFHVAHPTVVVRQPDANWSKPPSAGPMDMEQRTALDKAISRFQAVLELPDASKASRGVAAAYMLGRSYALRGDPGDAALAEKAFVVTRTLARAGLPDPDGLAVASFGDQARLRRAAGDLSSTIGLYAEQATRGSVEGVESLKWVAQALYQDPDGMAKVENIPLAQRVLIAYALEYNDDGSVHEYVYTPGGHPDGNVDNGTMDLIVRTARQWPKEKIAWPDRLAALAYRTGDIDFVHALVDGQDTALAWWLKAKLLLADGKLAEAETAYRKVMAKSLSVSDPDGLSFFNESAACAEMTQLERVREEFIPAMRDYVACSRTYQVQQPYDLPTYLGERVLTTAELQSIVTALPPDRASPTGSITDFPGAQLRTELAKRLMREGRYQDALAYADAVMVIAASTYDESFDTGLSKNLKTQRDMIQAYAAAHDQAQNASSAVAKAAAWYQLALLTRVEHSQIFDHDSPLYKDRATPDLPGVSPGELARLKQNYATPDQDNLRWYIAFDDALKAAQLVPTHSQAYAAILCHAAHWMNEAPPEAIDGRDPIAGLQQAWQLYVKHGAYVRWTTDFGHHCQDPDFDAAARPAWWHRFTRFIARLHIHPLTLIAVGSALLILALVLIGLLIIKRRKGAPAAS